MYTIIIQTQKVHQNTLRQLILVATREAVVRIEITRHPTITKKIEKIQLKQKDSPRKVHEKHNLLQITVINQMTAEITMTIEADHQVIIAKNEADLLTDDNKTIAEAELQRIIHIGRIHRDETDTNHLETDINHQDAMIATNHLEEIPDTNHLNKIQDTNHPDAITIDLPVETTDPPNIAQIQPITVYNKVTIMQ
jgi:hypothetical protein